jgi:class 3 adenylate cyclase
METHGMPGHIQITRATYELLKDEFRCEARGTVSVKGKGEMETWYLLALRQNREAVPYREVVAAATSAPEVAGSS